MSGVLGVICHTRYDENLRSCEYATANILLHDPLEIYPPFLISLFSEIYDAVGRTLHFRLRLRLR